MRFLQLALVILLGMASTSAAAGPDPLEWLKSTLAARRVLYNFVSESTFFARSRTGGRPKKRWLRDGWAWTDLV